ncbi:hypothetical protein BGZ96_012236 [Linnemannia gamsii]|uniref:Centromere protein M n=1 Tax=Linnemannia gamsii TaxID=64522 RepID=A0ABQ7JQS7_9FUNG|nr:hypothetical protein BGZ96_012236 [Linnemannia gamsii]
MQLVGHAGIGKRRLASYIRTEITVPPLTPTSSSTTDPSANATLPSITTNVAQPCSRSSTSNTNVSFRTAETLPGGIGQEDGQNSTLPVLRALPSIDNNINSSAETGVNAQGAVESVARYDLILLLVTMSNQDSWDDCKQALLRLDPGWFLGRCAIVVTEVENVSKYAFDRDEITEFLERFYNIPTVWTNLDITSEATLAATQIVRLLEIASGYRRQERDYSLTSLSQATALSSSTGALASLSSTASLSGLYLGSNIGNRIHTTPSFIRTPIPYNVPVTVLAKEGDLEMAAEMESPESDMKRVRGDLEDEDV